jgi:hypothetical protein
MTIFLFFFCILAAVYHLMWESLIAPTFRMKFRFELFMLRDKVRLYQCEETTSEPDRSVAEDVESMINHAIQLLHTATISSIQSARKELSENRDLKKRIEKRHASIEANVEMKAISSRVTDLVASGFIVNSGGWFIYLIPVLGVMLSITALKRSLDQVLAAKSYELESFDSGSVCVPA